MPLVRFVQGPLCCDADTLYLLSLAFYERRQKAIAVYDSQNQYHIPIFQVALDNTVLPHQDLTVLTIWKFRYHTTTLGEIPETSDRRPDSPDHDVGVLFGIPRNELVYLTEIFKRRPCPGYCSHSSLRLTTSS